MDGDDNMKKLTFATAAATLVLVPALVHAQARAKGEAGVQVQSDANVDASAGSRSTLSASAQARVDADLRAARERDLPEQPIRRRVAEGQAKGASEASIVMASGRALAELQTSHDAMVSAGRKHPSSEETARGAQLVARGYTSAQLEAVARRAPSDRSLVVAFDALASLRSRGMSTANAAAQIEQRLAARASDAELRDLAVNANAAARADGALGVGRGTGNVGAGAAGSAAAGAGSVAGSAAAGAGASAAGALGSGAAGVAGGAAGAVGGALGRRP
jgi:hypothetical protein